MVWYVVKGNLFVSACLTQLSINRILPSIVLIRCFVILSPYLVWSGFVIIGVSDFAKGCSLQSFTLLGRTVIESSVFSFGIYKLLSTWNKSRRRWLSWRGRKRRPKREPRRLKTNLQKQTPKPKQWVDLGPCQHSAQLSLVCSFVFHLFDIQSSISAYEVNKNHKEAWQSHLDLAISIFLHIFFCGEVAFLHKRGAKPKEFHFLHVSTAVLYICLLNLHIQAWNLVVFCKFRSLIACIIALSICEDQFWRMPRVLSANTLEYIGWQDIAYSNNLDYLIEKEIYSYSSTKIESHLRLIPKINILAQLFIIH